MKKKIIGVTGGVGSGKSTVLNLLADTYHAKIIEADRVARELMEAGGVCYDAVVEAFGREILKDEEIEEGGLPDPAAEPRRPIDRAKLAAIAFSDPGMREKLNSLTHPLVKAEVKKRMQETASTLIVYESAIPREAYMRELVDEIWYVHVPRKTRIKRLMDSRGYSREKCLSIMAAQMSEQEFTDLADVIIENGGSSEETEKQLQSILGSAIL